MELVEDLGMLPVGSKGELKRFGMYECPECGVHFKVVTADVLNGKSTKCKSCAARLNGLIRSKLAGANFVANSIKVHGGLYAYDWVNYINSRVKVKIFCKKHGEFFWQAPTHHLHGHGCPKCGFERSDIAIRTYGSNDIPTQLYYIHFIDSNLWKIGCTSKDIAGRFRYDKLNYKVLSVKQYLHGYEAYLVERYILKKTINSKFTGVLLKDGNSELRTQPIENLELLIEEAEKHIKENNAH